MSPDDYFQAFFSLFILAAFTGYLAIGGAFIDWLNKRKDK